MGVLDFESHGGTSTLRPVLEPLIQTRPALREAPHVLPTLPWAAWGGFFPPHQMMSVLDPLFILGSPPLQPAGHHAPGECLPHSCVLNDARLPKWRRHLLLTTLDSGGSRLSPSSPCRAGSFAFVQESQRPELLALRLAHSRSFPKC